MTTRQSELLRISLVLPFVLVCYLFGWSAWRGFTCSVFVHFANFIGMSASRISQNSFICAGHVYRFQIACTALDAFAGSIPLLWMERKGLWRNLGFFATYFIALAGFNQIRLALGLWLFLRGLPWLVSHEAFAGIFYFGLFLWIAHRREWSVGRAAAPLPAMS